jgi:hypothetical protein
VDESLDRIFSSGGEGTMLILAIWNLVTHPRAGYPIREFVHRWSLYAVVLISLALPPNACKFLSHVPLKKSELVVSVTIQPQLYIANPILLMHH